ncbi:uncharacterized protein LOC119549915 [Drosophila subpulchrella]|uniref:uncharacterized protein LOC119549915 n=1 Tax=Drosophila subpulchrella TaxID=1486046 RepID=UPI0018A139F6|nr:uncharacterized protein LOC119549915 [Drosophila subpulchrella]
MQLYTICLVLLYVIYSLNGHPRSDQDLDHQLENPVVITNLKMDAIINTNPVRNNNKATKILNTLIKLCKSETGYSDNPKSDITLGSQSIRNLNALKNNITMSEVLMPYIKVVFVKDAKALEKYKEKANIYNTSDTTIIIQRPRSKKRPRTASVKDCVLTKAKQLNL